MKFSSFVLLNESVIDEIKQELDTGKILVFVAGTFGSGKTYYIEHNLEGYETLDIDDIAMDLAGIEHPKDEAERSKIRKMSPTAIKIKTKKIKDNIKQGKSFIDVGTFANIKSAQNKIKLAKDNGFKTALIHINVSPEIAIKRNLDRIAQGERGVEPEEAEKKIRSRHEDLRKVIDTIIKDLDYYLEVKN